MSEEKEYIVTLHNKKDAEQFYEEMETNKSTESIPSKNFYCDKRREISRNTHYYMTDEEANQILSDDRVKAVEEPPENRGIEVRPVFEYDSTTHFDKGGSTSNMKVQWGILRCYSGKSSSAEYAGSWLPRSIVSTGNEEGQNVDLVIVDGNIDPSHPEFAVNSDGTGGTRVVQRDWTGSYTYTPYVDSGNSDRTNDNNHGCHVAGTAAGNRQGWARQANIYNLNPYGSAPTYINSSLIFDYIRTFHNGKTNGNPTVVNNSWTYVSYDTYPISTVVYRGTTYNSVNLSDGNDYGINHANATHWLIMNKISGVDADIEDCIDDGIIVIGAHGNYNMKITANTSDPDFNNYLSDGGSTDFYCKGGSPTHSPGAISVGSVYSAYTGGSSRNDATAYYSNKGDRVDVWAPGSMIQSSVHSGGIADDRDSSYYLTQYSGTSMASPQVAGIIACVVGVYRDFTQADVLDYLISRSTYDQLYDSGSADHDDTYNLMGAPNRHVHFHRERKVAGHVTPDPDRRIRDTHSTSTRQTYPRMKRNYLSGNA